jgi:diacylglycerol kinase family enzyme
MLSSAAPRPSDPPIARRIPAFVNPSSPNAAAARAALLESGRFEIRDLVRETLREQIEEIVRSGAPRVVVAGGDGTLGTAAAALIGHPTALAVIPAGTMNHFAKDHGIPETPAGAIAAALSDTIDRVDVGLVGDSVFLNTASVGLYVDYVRRRERVERFIGYRAGSLIAAFSTFLHPRLLSVEVQIAGAAKRYDTPLVFVGVGERELKAPKFGGRIEGGQRGLHVIVVRGRRPARLFALALAAAARGLESVAATPHVDSFIVDSCVVRVARRRSVTVGLDGELFRVPAPLEFRVRLDAVRVIAAKHPADHAGTPQ